jgi:hypothetical protein
MLRIRATMYLFTYFKDNGQDGLHLAVSDDGLHYRPLFNDASVLKPAVGDEPLMRDPNVCVGPDGTFHLVWTTAWTGQQIGYASSKDLVNWSPQRGIPVMAHEPACRNTWAPEIAYDEKLGHFVIFWSSTIPGRFPETQVDGDAGYNHRLYYTTTTDFVHFEPTRLLWDPGFNVIDATFHRAADGQLWLIVKDETIEPTKKNLRVARAESYTGPFGPAGVPFTESWVEGPTLVTFGGDAVCFFDCYTRHRYGAMRSRDLRTWTDCSESITMPAGARHGTIVEIDDALGREVERLAVGG